MSFSRYTKDRHLPRFAKTALLAAAALAPIALVYDGDDQPAPASLFAPAARAAERTLNSNAENIYWFTDGFYSDTAKTSLLGAYDTGDTVTLELFRTPDANLYLQNPITLTDTNSGTGVAAPSLGAPYAVTGTAALTFAGSGLTTPTIYFDTAGSSTTGNLTGTGTIVWSPNTSLTLAFKPVENASFIGNLLVNNGTVRMGTNDGGNNLLFGKTAGSAKIYVNTGATFSIVPYSNSASTKWWSGDFGNTAADNVIPNDFYLNGGVLEVAQTGSWTNSVEIAGTLTISGTTSEPTHLKAATVIGTGAVLSRGLVFSGKVTSPAKMGDGTLYQLTIDNTNGVVVFTNANNDYQGKTVLDGTLSLYGAGVLPTPAAGATAGTGTVSINGTGVLRFDKSSTYTVPSEIEIESTTAGATIQVASGTIVFTREYVNYGTKLVVGGNPAEPNKDVAPVLQVGDGGVGGWFGTFDSNVASVVVGDATPIGSDTTTHENAAAAVLSFNFSSATTRTVAAKITGAGTVRILGGIITLSNVENNYNNTEITGGTLALPVAYSGINSADVLGYGTIYIGGTGSVFDLSRVGTNITLTNAIASTDDANASQGKINISQRLTLTTGGTTYAGEFTGIGSLTFSPTSPTGTAGTLTLTGKLAHTGDTEVRAGTLIIQNNGLGGDKTTELAIRADGNLTLTGGSTSLRVDDTTTTASDGSVILNTSGKLTFLGGAQLKTGSFTAYTGTIELTTEGDSLTADGTGSTGGFVKNSSTTVTIKGAGTAMLATASRLQARGGTLIIDNATLRVSGLADFTSPDYTDPDTTNLTLKNGAIADFAYSGGTARVSFNLRTHEDANEVQKWDAKVSLLNGSILKSAGSLDIVAGYFAGDGTTNPLTEAENAIIVQGNLGFYGAQNLRDVFKLETITLRSTSGSITINQYTDLVITRAPNTEALIGVTLAANPNAPQGSSGGKIEFVKSGAYSPKLIFDLSNSVPSTSEETAINAAPLLKLSGSTFSGASLADVSIDITGFDAGSTGFFTILDASDFKWGVGSGGLALPTNLTLNGAVPSATFVRSSDGTAVARLALDNSKTRLLLKIVVSDATVDGLLWTGASTTDPGLWRNDDGETLAENWTGEVGGNPVLTFLNGDSVIFSTDVTGTAGIITVESGDAAPLAKKITVSATSPATTYTFTGGPIQDYDDPKTDDVEQTSILKTNVSTLVLAAKNTFTGGIEIAGGTVELRRLDAAGTGEIKFTSTDSKLVLNTANTGESGGGAIFALPLTTTPNVKGLGEIIKTGAAAATLKLNLASNYSGALTLNDGTAEVHNRLTLDGAHDVPYDVNGESKVVTVTGTFNFSTLRVGKYADLTIADKTTVATAGTAIFEGGSLLTVRNPQIVVNANDPDDPNVSLRVTGSLNFNTAGSGSSAVRPTINITGTVVENENNYDYTNHPVHLASAPFIYAPSGFIVQRNGITQPESVTIEKYENLDVEIVTRDVLGSDGKPTGSTNDFLELKTVYTWNNTGAHEQHGTFQIDLVDTDGDGILEDPREILREGLKDNPLSNGTGFVDGWNGPLGWDGKTLTKTGAGTLILNKTSTYTGETIIRGGTLEIQAGDAAGSDEAAVRVLSASEIGSSATANARLVFNILSDPDNENALTLVTFSKPIAGGGDVIKTGSGELRLTYANTTFTGSILVEKGILTLANQRAAGDIDNENALTLASEDAVLRIETPRYDSWEIARAIGGTGSFEKAGEGRLALTGTNTYTGTTSIRAGELIISSPNALGTNPTVNIALSTSTLTVEVPATAVEENAWRWNKITEGAGALVKDGSGTLVLHAPAAHTGGTTVKYGILTLENRYAAGTNGVTTDASGALIATRPTIALTTAGSNLNLDIKTDTYKTTGTSGSFSINIAKDADKTVTLGAKDGINSEGNDTFASSTFYTDSALTITPVIATGSADSTKISVTGSYHAASAAAVTLAETAGATVSLAFNAKSAEQLNDVPAAVTIKNAADDGASFAVTANNTGFILQDTTQGNAGNETVKNLQLAYQKDNVNVTETLHYSDNEVFLTPQGNSVRLTAYYNISNDPRLTLNPSALAANTESSVTVVSTGGSYTAKYENVTVTETKTTRELVLHVAGDDVKVAFGSSGTIPVTVTGGELRIIIETEEVTVPATETEPEKKETKVTARVGDQVFTLDTSATSAQFTLSASSAFKLRNEREFTSLESGVAEITTGTGDKFTFNDEDALVTTTRVLTAQEGKFEIKADGDADATFAIATADSPIAINSERGEITFTTDDAGTVTLSTEKDVNTGDVTRIDAPRDNVTFNSADAVLTAVLTGVGKLTKLGDGTVTLPASNPSYSGNVEIKSGTLALRAADAAGTGAIEVAWKATLRYETQYAKAENAAWLVPQVISGAGALVKDGGYVLDGIGNRVTTTLNLAAFNTYSGNTTVNGGELLLTGTLNDGNKNNNLAPLYTGELRLNALDASFIASQPAGTVQTLAGIISGYGSITKRGASTTLILSAANTYTGNTRIEDGTLTVTGTLGAPNYNSTTFLYEGDVQLLAATAKLELARADVNTKQTLAGTVAGTGELIKRGGSTLILAGAVSVPVKIEGGVYQIGNTHNRAGGLPETPSLASSLTVSAGTTLNFDIYGGNLADLLTVESFKFASSTAGDSFIVNLSTLENGTYKILTVSGSGATLDALSPNATITTLVNGSPIDAGSTSAVRYEVAEDGRSLLLLVTGTDIGAGSEVSANRSLIWAAGNGVWDTSASNTNWRRTTDSATATTRKFNDRDIATFSVAKGTTINIDVPAPLNVSAFSANIAGDLTINFQHNATAAAGGRETGITSTVKANLDGGNATFLKTGAGTLTFTAPAGAAAADFRAVFDGGVTVREGAVRLENTALVASQTKSVTLRVESSASIELGNRTGATGALVAPFVASSIINNGFLSGNGTISGGFVNNGTLSPGFSAGSITIDTGTDGTGTFVNNGKIILEVFTGEDGAITHDTLYYTGKNNAFVGGTIVISVDPQFLKTHYDRGGVTLPALLQTLDGSEGTIRFDDEPGASNLQLEFSNATLSGEIVDPATGVIKVWQDFAKLPGITKIEKSLAAHLTDLARETAGDNNFELTNLFDAIYNASEGGSPKDAAKIIRSVSPYNFGSLLALPIQSSQAAADSLRNYLVNRRKDLRDIPDKRLLESPKTDAYFFANGSFTRNTAGDSGALPFDVDSYGGTVGFDGWLSKYFLAGVNLAANSARAKFHENTGRARQSEGRLTAYGSLAPTKWLAFDGAVFGGISRYDTRRVTAIAPITPESSGLDGKTDGLAFGASATVSFVLDFVNNESNAVSISPFIGFDYVSVEVGNFSETYEATRGALTLDKFTGDSFRAKIGASLDWSLKNRFRLRFLAAYGAELLDTEKDISARFANGTGWAKSFNTNVKYNSESLVELSPSIEFQLGRHFALGISYSYETDLDSRDSHRINASFRMRF